MNLVQNELFTENPINKFFTCEEIGKKHTTVELYHQTICTACGLVADEDILIATPNKDDLNPEIPIKHPKILGSLILKKDLEYKSTSYKTELKEILQRLKESGTFSVWTPKKIDEAFDTFIIELNDRVPTYQEFQERFPGAIDAIHKGRYNPKITKWSEFVRSRGKDIHVHYWTSKEVDKIFIDLTKELGGFPKSTEFQERFKGPYKMILEARYSPKIRTWKKFLELMILYQSFYDLEEKLGRIPTYKEFNNEFKKIRKRNPEIKSYNDFLRYMGRKPNKENGFWTYEKIKETYYKLKETLNRTPTRREFARKHSGAYQAIRRGNFDINITTYNEFLEKIGETTNRHEGNYWTSDKIKETYLELMKELKRHPKTTEFQNRYSGAYNAILKGGFHPDVTTYKDFVDAIKKEINFNISSNIMVDSSSIILVHTSRK